MLVILKQEITGGRGVDVAVEALGRAQTFSQCVQSVMDGGKAVMIGLTLSGAKGEVDINHLVRRQVCILFLYIIIIIIVLYSLIHAKINCCNLESLLPNPNIIANIVRFVIVCASVLSYLEEEMWMKPQSFFLILFFTFKCNKIDECAHMMGAS